MICTASPLRLRASVVLAAVAISALAPVSAAKASTTEHFSYTGSAYGTSVNVGSLVKSGPSAPVTFGCTTNGDLHKTNTVAGINVPTLATSGTVSTTADTYASPVQSKTSATTEQVNLLSGLVRATAIKAVSSTTRTSTGGYALSSSGTTLGTLVVGGKAVSANAAPNTRIDLSGIGYLIVNEQVKKTNGLAVNGLHLFVTTSNALGVAIGSNVTISHAVTALSGPVSGVLGGYSYGTKADVGTLALSGPSFTEFMPCLGTSGVVRSNTGAGVHIGTSLNTSTILNTVKGTVTATSATGETTSTVQAANLLSGLVSATLVKADAHASVSGTTYAFSDSGSTIGSLSVHGHPEITPSAAANTQVALAGVGTLYLHRVLRTSHSVTVRMIELVLTSPVNGLAAGTDIKVAVANASAS